VCDDVFVVFLLCVGGGWCSGCRFMLPFFLFSPSTHVRAQNAYLVLARVEGKVADVERGRQLERAKVLLLFWLFCLFFICGVVVLLV
jgi:hypothetical protein